MCSFAHPRSCVLLSTNSLLSLSPFHIRLLPLCAGGKCTGSFGPHAPRRWLAGDSSGSRPRVGPRAPAPRHLLRRRFFPCISLKNSLCHNVLLPPASSPPRSFRWRANARSVSAKAHFTANLQVRCQTLSPNVGTHDYPCVVRRGTLGKEHVGRKSLMYAGRLFAPQVQLRRLLADTSRLRCRFQVLRPHQSD